MPRVIGESRRDCESTMHQQYTLRQKAKRNRDEEQALTNDGADEGKRNRQRNFVRQIHTVQRNIITYEDSEPLTDDCSRGYGRVQPTREFTGVLWNFDNAPTFEAGMCLVVIEAPFEFQRMVESKATPVVSQKNHVKPNRCVQTACEASAREY